VVATSVQYGDLADDSFVKAVKEPLGLLLQLFEPEGLSLLGVERSGEVVVDGLHDPLRN